MIGASAELVETILRWAQEVAPAVRAATAAPGDKLPEMAGPPPQAGLRLGR